jgi:hypothetical protein
MNKATPECMGNAGRVAGQHAWTIVGTHRGKRCVGCGRTRAQLKRIAHAANMAKLVSQEWREPDDGYWILLKIGFHCDDAHAIHEPNKRAARARMRDVKPCNCPDCAKPTGQRAAPGESVNATTTHQGDGK